MGYSAVLFLDPKEKLYLDECGPANFFAMQPMEGGNFRQEILGYSMLSALGIRGDEIK